MNVATEQEFAAIVRKVYEAHQEEIELLKQESFERCEQADLIWEMILLSFSTWGNSKGRALVENHALHDPIRYQALLILSENERRHALKKSLYEAGVRYANVKVRLLMDNFEWIVDRGGPDKVRQELENQPGFKRKIAFLKQLGGIGDKYARNMMMDICHSDFQDSIAIDLRIKKVSKALGRVVSENNYAAEEQFYLGIAKQAGLTGWELDRLLYRFEREVISLFCKTPPPTKPDKAMRHPESSVDSPHH